MKYISLNIGGQSITPPSNVPSGDISYVQQIVQVGLNLAFLLGIVLALFFLFYAGYSWMTSEGDKQKLANARGRLAVAIIGLVLIFVSYAIINTIGYFFHVDLLQINPFATPYPCLPGHGC